MLISGRPLGDNRLDAALFVDRATELEAVVAAVDARLNTLVLGGRGAGKSSFLRHVVYRLRARPEAPAVEFVDGSLAGDAHGVLALVADRVAGPESFREYAWNRPTTLTGRVVERPTEPGRLLSHVDRMRAHLEEEDPDDGTPYHRLPVVVCLDNLSPDVAHKLFGRMRDELWSVPLVWIVAADQDHRAGFLQPPADAFFEQRVELAPLDEQQAADLLVRRVPDLPEDVAQRIVVTHAPASPRELLNALRDALAPPDEAKSPPDLVERAALELGRPAAMLVAEMLSRDSGVSASDEQLLRRLGWTRARAAQVLRELEGAELVRSSLLSHGGPGRPRKVYELVRG